MSSTSAPGPSRPETIKGTPAITATAHGEGGGRAVVIGASMAGLLAARVLADTFEKVTIVDRDGMPKDASHRRGVPQSRHVHALLGRGREILEELFPRLTEDLVSQGAITGDTQERARWYNEGIRIRPAPSGLISLLVSRPRLEWYVRSRVAALEQVEIVERGDVAGLVATDGRRQVCGIRLFRAADSSAEEVVEADLVVDASGRGSRSPIWLEELGYGRPDENEVRVRVGYASCVYRYRPDHLPGSNSVLVAASRDNRRGGVLLRMEGERWLATLYGYSGDRPPTDLDGFAKFAATLPVPDIYHVVKDAEPIDEPMPARYPASVRRRYERLDCFPDGYVVIGDALCGFNPVFAQGMTVAALEAIALRRCVRDGPVGLPQRFFREASRIVDVPWSIATLSDLRFPEVDGPRGIKTRVVNAYISRMHRAAEHDAAVGLAFLRVVNLLDRPERLFRPSIALRVVRYGRSSTKVVDPHPARGLVQSSARAGR